MLDGDGDDGEEGISLDDGDDGDGQQQGLRKPTKAEITIVARYVRLLVSHYHDSEEYQREVQATVNRRAETVHQQRSDCLPFGSKPCGIIANTVKDNNSCNSRQDVDINECEEIRVKRKDEQQLDWFMRAWFGRTHPDDLANAIRRLLHRKILQAYRKWRATISEQANEFESPSTAITKGLGIPIQIRGQSLSTLKNHPHPPRAALPEFSNNRLYLHERRKIINYGDITKATTSFKRIKTVLPKADTNFGLRSFVFPKVDQFFGNKIFDFQKADQFFEVNDDRPPYIRGQHHGSQNVEMREECAVKEELKLAKSPLTGKLNNDLMVVNRPPDDVYAIRLVNAEPPLALACTGKVIVDATCANPEANLGPAINGDSSSRTAKAASGGSDVEKFGAAEVAAEVNSVAAMAAGAATCAQASAAAGAKFKVSIPSSSDAVAVRSYCYKSRWCQSYFHRSCCRRN